ncbi:MAG: hypothetical protein MI810_18035 [Flavobacteriales bacterium]|nr:hypothetical protein [Flavobacteriales bacterium]
MKRILLLLTLVLLISVPALSQLNKYARPGDFQLGMRTTTSLFGHDNVTGLGYGGQFRVQILKNLNTEWFSDWISMDLNGAGKRENAHIGWSLMFYPYTKGKLMPYIAAGHCFDYARVTPLSTVFEDRNGDVVERWSSAVQGGLGTHFFLSDRFNISVSAKYMLHLGKHLEYELTQTADGYYVDTHNHNDDTGRTLEGHLLLTASLNYRIFCLSKKNWRTND